MTYICPNIIQRKSQSIKRVNVVCLPLRSIPTGTKSLHQRYNGPVNNVFTQIPSWLFFSCYSPGLEDRLAGCWRSSELCLLVPWSPGDGQATSPSDLAAPGHSRDKPTGCHVAVSMEMRRQAGHGSDSHLHGQRLSVSAETSLPNSSCTQVVIAPTPTPKPFIFFSFFFLSLLKPVQAQRGTALPTQINPPCPGSATLVRPAGNSGGMLD